MTDDVRDAVESAVARRFRRRVVVLEEPEVVDWLNQHAQAFGRSLAAECRAAIRYWISAHGDEP